MERCFRNTPRSGHPLFVPMRPPALCGPKPFNPLLHTLHVLKHTAGDLAVALHPAFGCIFAVNSKYRSIRHTV